jgi:hypothetical protein
MDPRNSGALTDFEGAKLFEQFVFNVADHLRRGAMRIADLNIARFKKLLEIETDPVKRENAQTAARREEAKSGNCPGQRN